MDVVEGGEVEAMNAAGLVKVQVQGACSGENRDSGCAGGGVDRKVPMVL